MIFGIGTDVVEVKRMRQSLKRLGDCYAFNILSDKELDSFSKSENKHRFLAKRFAAKEAFVKALGTGFIAPAIPKNISISHDKLGKPILEFSMELRAYMDYKQIGSEHISISDEKNIASAFVVLTSKS
jgi:holo-[acyl-carrier protein] synthase